MRGIFVYGNDVSLISAGTGDGVNAALRQPGVDGLALSYCPSRAP
jgi:hypothetical protein